MAKRKNLNTIPTIESTKDYSKFKFHHSNRPTPGPHVSAIMHEIQQNPNSIKYNPILINKKGYIIDGQNRFKACVKLGLPIFYIQADDLSIADIPTLNRNQKSWSLNNYVHFFSSYHNKKDYKRIKALQKKYPISTGVISALLALGRNYRAIDHGFSKVNETIKDGSYQINFESFFVKFAKTLLSIKTKYDKNFVFKRSFVNAFYELYTHPDYSKKELFEALDNRSHELVNLPDSESYKVLLQDILDNEDVKII